MTRIDSRRRVTALGATAAVVAGALAVGGYLAANGGAAASAQGPATLAGPVVGNAAVPGALSVAAVTPAPTVPSAVPSTAPDTVTVDGTGKAAGTPNALDLQLDVDVTDRDAAAALASSSATMARIQQVLRDKGVKPADLQTSGVSLQPNYDYPNNGGNPRLTGFSASESLDVTLRSISTAGATINAVVQTGGNAVRIDGVNLDLGADSALMSQARAQAFADAKTKAGQYAGLAGRRLGAVVSVTETDASPVSQPFRGALSAGAASSAVPVQPGSQEVSVDVQVVWSLS